MVRFFHRRHFRLIRKSRGVRYFFGRSGGPPVVVVGWGIVWKVVAGFPWDHIEGGEGEWWAGRDRGRLILMGYGHSPDLVIAQGRWRRLVLRRRGLVLIPLPGSAPCKIYAILPSRKKRGADGRPMGQLRS